MSYRLKIDPKSRKAARFISRLQKAIQKALIDSGKSQQDVATILGVDRSVINRRLSGKANLTARSIAEFAYALDKDIEFSFVDKSTIRHSNSANATGISFNLQPVTRSVGGRSETAGTASPEQMFSLEGATL
jgi:transcriptional regulator with XRE-family HTH domain